MTETLNVGTTFAAAGAASARPAASTLSNAAKMAIFVADLGVVRIEFIVESEAEFGFVWLESLAFFCLRPLAGFCPSYVASTGYFLRAATALGIFPVPDAMPALESVVMTDFVKQAVAMIGPDPEGEPEELERYARELSMQADKLDSLSLGYVAIIENAGLRKGPFAERTKAEANTGARELKLCAADARHAALLVRRDAARLRSERASWASQVQSAARRLMQEAKEAAGN